ncbi:obscurin-like [Micropterus dolomieu]|uniref:obscurin-like n=1 Tax=Micropterus dolomieu TaxID=147949 RepID=UPI001E8DC7E8|nr:obscurin-like [Micropterus dolomieu]
MGHTLLCVLGLFLLNTLLYGHAEVHNRAVVTLQPNWTQIFSGETFTVRCEIQGGGDTKWMYEWTPTKLNRPPTDKEYRIIRATVSHSGDYSCKGRRDSYSSTKWSDVIKLTVSSQRPKAELRADWRDFPAGGSVTLSCSVNPSSGWKYFWYRGEKTSEPLNTQDAVFISNGQISVSQGGLYWCRGGRGDPVYYTEDSDAIVPNRAVVTLQPNWSEIYSGETITLRCEIKDGGDTEWEYEWKTTSSYKPLKDSEYRIRSAYSSHSGDYRCKGRMKSAQQSSTDWSDPVKLTVSYKPQSVLTVSPSWLSPGASVTLSCRVKDPSAGWRFFWFKAVPKLSGNYYDQELLPGSSNGTEQDSYIVHGQTHTAGYKCRAGRGDPVYYTYYSEPKFVWSGVHNRAVVTLQPNWLQIFSGETFTVRCEIQGGGDTKWTYEWTPAKLNRPPTDNEYRISRATVSHSGDYSCKGRRDSYSSTEWSDVIKLTVSSQKPKAQLRADRRTIPAGGSVTLSCSVNPSSGWKYFWYRGEKTSEPLNTQDAVFISDGPFSVSQGGLYWCRGGRGDPVYYTEESDAIVTNRAVVTLQPNWSEIYSGETITLRCEIKDGGDTEWEYEWKTSSSYKPLKQSEYMEIRANVNNRGNYRCKGKMALYSSTEWSDPFTLTLSAQRPKAKLRADWRTIPAGGSVTLSCSVNPSSGWKYFWYRGEKTSEPLNTQDAVFISDRQISVSQGGLYWCRGGRGDPVYYTEHSDPVSINKIMSNRAVVTLQPNWLQIFSGETFTVRCEIQAGGDTKWTYEWTPAKLNRPPTDNEYRISRATVSHSGDYSCKGRRDSYSSTEWSDVITLTVSSQRPKAELRAFRRTIPAGGSVTLSCSVNPSSGWKYFWYRGEKTSEPLNTQDAVFISDGPISVSQGGLYWCRGGRGDPVYYTEDSDAVVTNRAVVTLQTSWPEIYRGEKITLRCEIKDGGDTEWEYKWSTPHSDTVTKHTYGVISATVNSGGNYWCMGEHKKTQLYSTEWSDLFMLRVSAQRPKAELSADRRDFPAGGSVTLSCSVNPSSGWKYFWYRGKKTYKPLTTNDAVFISDGQISVSQGGLYWCRGGRGDPVYYTEDSDAVSINKIMSNRAVVTLQPNWTQIFSGETFTVRCEIQGGGNTKWTYEWTPAKLNRPTTYNEYRIIRATVSHSGDYSCKGRRDSYSSTEWSDVIKLTVSSKRPKAELSADRRDFPAGGSVTLSCSVNLSSGWKYFWYRGEKTSEPLNTQDAVFISDGQISVSQGGLYWCRGGRGDPVYYTEHSDPVSINKINRPQPVLTVSPSWLSPGASVTLSCRVKDPSAGWRFFWFKAVPKHSDYSYSHELLPGSSNGTEQDSYIVHGQTHTAGYKCRAGRGDPVNYTSYSEPKFVWFADCLKEVKTWMELNFRWSGGNNTKLSQRPDFHSSASLTVSPDRVQHFTSDSVSLSCEGNSTEWRVRRFTEDDYPSYSSYCSYWGTMTGSTCSINSNQQSDAVYWCESGSGEFSNAVNITKQMSRPESSSVPVPLIVGLVCGIVFILLLLLLYRYRPSKDSCSIRSIQSESTNRGPDTVYVVDQNEAQRDEYSTLLHGDVCLYETIKGSKENENDSCSIRPIQSESTNRGPDTVYVVDQNEAQRDEYSTLLHGDVCLYETIKGSKENENGDACLYETIKGPKDTENDADESQDEDVL